MTDLYLNTADREAQLRFWCGALTATPTEEGCQIPGAAIVMRDQAPTGGTAGSVMDHLGLQVNRLASFLERLDQAGIQYQPNPNGFQAMVTGPDGLRVELAELRTQPEPVRLHHIHFYTMDPLATQRWYAETLGAVPGKRMHFDAADLPELNLTFSPSESGREPTEGRAFHAIGFADRNRALTDPWGTGILPGRCSAKD